MCYIRGLRLGWVQGSGSWKDSFKGGLRILYISALGISRRIPAFGILGFRVAVSRVWIPNEREDVIVLGVGPFTRALSQLGVLAQGVFAFGQPPNPQSQTLIPKCPSPNLAFACRALAFNLSICWEMSCFGRRFAVRAFWPQTVQRLQGFGC